MRKQTSGSKPQDRRRVTRFRFDLTKAIFVLPNLFTLSSIFCGVYAILHLGGEPGPSEFHRACLAIFFGIFFDMTDGRVARLTKTQSDFGVQLDSLADAITFGVAPAVIVYKWALVPMGVLGLVIVFAYTACGVIRLARFNVLASQTTHMSSFFQGIPIPLAAGLLAAYVMHSQQVMTTAPTEKQSTIIGLVLLSSALMVSNVRYRNFKDIGATRKAVAVLCVLLALFVALAMAVRPSFAMFAFFCGYIFVGLAEELRYLTKRIPHPAVGSENNLDSPAPTDDTTSD